MACLGPPTAKLRSNHAISSYSVAFQSKVIKRLKDKNECFLYIQVLLYAVWLIHVMEPNWQKD